MNLLLRQTLPVIVALAAALPALADAKGEAILKEVELRARKIETYSADLAVRENGSASTASAAVQQPDKLFFTFIDRKRSGTIIANGKVASVLENGKSSAIAADDLRPLKINLWNILTGNARALVGEYQEAKFVTQKLIDDVTVLDVIDVIGSKATVRLYVNGSSFVERVTSNEKALARVMDFTFTNLKIDESIPAERFALPK